MIVDVAVVSGASVAALLVVHTITFAIGHRIGRYNVVDVAWGLGFIAVAAVAAVLGTGDPIRRWLLLALVAIWGLRLSGYIYRRSAGQGEDPRYADLLRDATIGQILAKVFVLQGFATWFISLPLQLSAVAGPTPRRWLAATLAGVLVWLTVSSSKPSATISCGYSRPTRPSRSADGSRPVGVDASSQLLRRRIRVVGTVADHITAWWSLATVLSPVLMTYFLVHATGARLTEKYMRAVRASANTSNGHRFSFRVHPDRRDHDDRGC